jgi:ABC-2 type transport system permease protein/lipopolysaccharide transport system permease protein
MSDKSGLSVNVSHWQLAFMSAWIRFLAGYRRTAIGPLWLLISPALFIACLGLLFSKINRAEEAVFIPFLSIGFILWTYISGFINGSATIFQRNRARIMQGTQTLDDVIRMEFANITIIFLHQVLVIVAVFVIFRIPLHWVALEALLGLAAVAINGIWVSRLFGILGARYRDLSEVLQAITRLAFLATPIIWLPQGHGRGGIIGAYILYNPFYHFLHVVRAPLLGYSPELLSWVVVCAFTVVGFTLAALFSARYAKHVPLWI